MSDDPARDHRDPISRTHDVNGTRVGEGESSEPILTSGGGKESEETGAEKQSGIASEGVISGGDVESESAVAGAGVRGDGETELAERTGDLSIKEDPESSSTVFNPADGPSQVTSITPVDPTHAASPIAEEGDLKETTLNGLPQSVEPVATSTTHDHLPQQKGNAKHPSRDAVEREAVESDTPIAHEESSAAPSSSTPSQPLPPPPEASANPTPKSQPPPPSTLTTPISMSTTSPSQTYILKEIYFPPFVIPTGPNERDFIEPRPYRIVTQNENGPCSLIALANILILRSEISITPHDRHSVTYDDLSGLIVDYLLRSIPPQETSTILDSALEVLPKTRFGLDLNLGFDGIESFPSGSGTPTSHPPLPSPSSPPQPATATATTPTRPSNDPLHLFQLSKIPLYHGWIPDPPPTTDEQTWTTLVSKIGNYDKAVQVLAEGDEVAGGQLVGEGDGAGGQGGGIAGIEGSERKAWSKEEEEKVQDAVIVRQFLSQSPTQLTYHGLILLNERLKPNSLVALFRNSHLSVLYRRPDFVLKPSDPQAPPGSAPIWQTAPLPPTLPTLFTLATDAAFLSESSVVWESLVDVDGTSGEFFDDGLRRSEGVIRRRERRWEEDRVRQEREWRGRVEQEDRDREEVDRTRRELGLGGAGRGRGQVGGDVGGEVWENDVVGGAGIGTGGVNEDADLALALALHQQEQEAAERERQARRQREQQQSQSQPHPPRRQPQRTASDSLQALRPGGSGSALGPSRPDDGREQRAGKKGKKEKECTIV